MVNIDFLPDRIRLQRARRKRLLRQGYLILLCVMGLVVLGYVREGTIAKAQATLDVVRDSGADMRRQLALRDVLEKQQGELQVIKRIDDHLGSRMTALDVLAELGRILPASMALTNLQFETVEVSLPVDMGPSADNGRAVRASNIREKNVKRVRLVLMGAAPNDVDVANFIGQMSASPLFEDINMGYAKSSDYHGRIAREFQVSCFLTQ